MNTRTLVFLGALVVLASAAVVSLDDGTAERDLPRGLAPPVAAASAPNEPAGPVRVAGLMVNGPLNTGAAPGSDDAFGVDLAFQGTFERTRLALELHHADGGLLAIDDEASALARFHDDRGTNLIEGDDAFGPFEMLPRISEDGRYMGFVLPSDELPARDASRLFAAGTLAVQVAHETAEHVSSEVALEPGATFSAGPFDFEITKVGESGWGEGFQVTLKTDRDTVAITGYALLPPDGAPIEADPTMSMSGMGTWQRTLSVDRLPDRAAFALEVWQDLETVEIPFEVEAGLGLR